MVLGRGGEVMVLGGGGEVMVLGGGGEVMVLGGGVVVVLGSIRALQGVFDGGDSGGGVGLWFNLNLQTSRIDDGGGVEFNKGFARCPRLGLCATDGGDGGGGVGLWFNWV
ncbi:glycine-rich cell wall structural protein 1.0-like [Cornus florida]|uniref:glycine-rich cell wall structural protein 1.0-like n=1 Tax=Cornus florida TaxID=4283 RepID=UPI0028A16F92|nr:glycine-rich cell wall structural protein 1.0-like [Cornus florida]